MRTVSAQLTIPPEKLLNCLSYNQFALLLTLDDALKRRFYEIECLQGNWSVRELKRQIASLYFERSGLSKDKKKLTELSQNKAEQLLPNLNIRDPYIFEFLGIKPREVMASLTWRMPCSTSCRTSCCSTWRRIEQVYLTHGDREWLMKSQ